MHTLFIVLLIIDCIALITVVFQEGKSNGLSGAISGGAEQLFGKQNNVASIYSCID